MTADAAAAHDRRPITLADIRALAPCYDPARYLPEDWAGAAGDVLAVEACPAEDRLWVALGLLSDRTRRLFAADVAERALDRVAARGEDVDPRSREAVAVARRHAAGEATDEELAAARAAAWAAAWDAELDAAWDAAMAAARDAARAAAMAAARAAARAAAWAAARDATRAAEMEWMLGHLAGMLGVDAAQPAEVPQ